MTLFNPEKTHLQLPNAELIYIPDFYNKTTADTYYNNLLNGTKWQQDEITVYGKTYKQPRLTALYGSTQKSYSYSNITMYPQNFTPLLEQMTNDIELIAETSFNVVLLNLYRHGQDSNGWHADNENELGTNPAIASLSFGAERPFHFKHRTLANEKYKLLLKHGSLLIMKGEMQHYWLHQIAKTKQFIQPRINLTFRYIK